MTAVKSIDMMGRMSDAYKACPACQNEMELEVGSCPTGSASLLNWFHVDVYRCPKCGWKSLGGPFFNI